MSAGTAEQLDEASLREAIEGVYTMESWHEGDRVEHPPAVDGRWVLVDGVFTSLLLKREPDGSRQTIAMMGGYDIADGAFTYGYDDGSYLIQRPDGATDTIPVPFGERRRFAASRDGGALRLVWQDGAAEFRITGDLVDYCEHGVVQRRWRRARRSSLA